jgi:uncharacterized repeat protein (TIGR02543 family)
MVTKNLLKGLIVMIVLLTFNIGTAFANDKYLLYYGNGNTGGDTPAALAVPANADPTAVTISDNVGNLEKTGYTLLRWNESASGGPESYSIASAPAGTAKYTTADLSSVEILKLYAEWDPNSYTLTYNANADTSKYTGADFTGSFLPPSASHKYTSAVSAAAALTMTGYTFKEWNSAADGSGQTTLSAGAPFSMTAGNIDLYAQWDINSYTVTYNANADNYTYANYTGTSPYTATYEYYKAVTAPNDLTITGYSFNSWNTKADGSGTSYTSVSFPMLPNDLPLYAQWDINSYTVTYKANADKYTGTVPQSAVHPYSTTVAVLDNVGKLEREGYTLEGWSNVTEGEGDDYTTTNAAGDSDTYTFFKMPAKEMILYADWEINLYTLTYNTNPGDSGYTLSVPASPKAYTYNSEVAAANALAMTGYTFDGWNSAANGKGTAYADGKNFSMTAANLTLHAIWKKHPTVQTYSAKNISANRAKVDGGVTDIGDSGIIQHGHVWSTSHNPTTANNKTEFGAKKDIGPYDSGSVLTGLKSGTTYYVRAYATNSYGTAYGDEKSFVTNSMSELPAEGKPITVQPDSVSKSFTFKLPDDGRKYNLTVTSTPYKGALTPVYDSDNKTYTFTPPNNSNFAGKYGITITDETDASFKRSFYINIPVLLEPDEPFITLMAGESQAFTLTGAAAGTAYTVIVDSLDDTQEDKTAGSSFNNYSTGTYSFDPDDYSVTNEVKEYSVKFEVEGLTAPDMVDISVVPSEGFVTDKIELTKDSEPVDYTSGKLFDFAGNNELASLFGFSGAYTSTNAKIKLVIKPPTEGSISKNVSVRKPQAQNQAGPLASKGVKWEIFGLEGIDIKVTVPIPCSNTGAIVSGEQVVWYKHNNEDWKSVAYDVTDSANSPVKILEAGHLISVDINTWSSNVVGVGSASYDTTTTSGGGGGCFINSLKADRGNIAWVAVSMLLFAVALTAIVRRKQRENS